MIYGEIFFLKQELSWVWISCMELRGLWPFKLYVSFRRYFYGVRLEKCVYISLRIGFVLFIRFLKGCVNMPILVKEPRPKPFRTLEPRDGRLHYYYKVSTVPPYWPLPAGGLESHPLMLDLAMDLLWPMKCKWMWLVKTLSRSFKHYHIVLPFPLPHEQHVSFRSCFFSLRLRMKRKWAELFLKVYLHEWEINFSCFKPLI